MQNILETKAWNLLILCPRLRKVGKASLWMNTSHPKYLEKVQKEPLKTQSPSCQ